MKKISVRSLAISHGSHTKLQQGYVSCGMDVVEMKFDLNNLRLHQTSMFLFGLLSILLSCFCKKLGLDLIPVWLYF